MKNPSAYPAKTYFFGELTGTRHEGEETPGMSLLDHFAGLAMQGLMANPRDVHVIGDDKSTKNGVSELSYAIARAMLEERAKPENQL